MGCIVHYIELFVMGVPFYLGCECFFDSSFLPGCLHVVKILIGVVSIVLVAILFGASIVFNLKFGQRQ